MTEGSYGCLACTGSHLVEVCIFQLPCGPIFVGGKPRLDLSK